MTITHQFPWLRREFESLVGAYRYPERVGDYAAWETWLGEYPQWAVKSVIFQAPDLWPASMPTVGELRRAVSGALQKQRSAERSNKPRPEPQGPTAAPMKPGFRRMADNIERESKRLGLDPDQETPQEIGMRRLRSIQALFGKHSKIETVDGDGVDLQTNPQGKQRRPQR